MKREIKCTCLVAVLTLMASTLSLQKSAAADAQAKSGVDRLYVIDCGDGMGQDQSRRGVYRLQPRKKNALAPFETRGIGGCPNAGADSKRRAPCGQPTNNLTTNAFSDSDASGSNPFAFGGSSSTVSRRK